MPSRETKDERLARIVCARYLDAAEARAPRDSAWNDARKRYEPSYIDKTLVKRPPYVKVPYLFRTVNVQVSQLLSASEANGLWVRARSTTPEHGSVGEIVTNLLQTQFEFKTSDLRYSNSESLERCARMGLLYGDSYVHLGFYEDDDEWGVKISLLDPFDVFPDWKAYRYVIVRRRVTLAELAEIAQTLSSPIREPIIDPTTGQPMTSPETGEILYNETPRDGGRAERAFKSILKQIESGMADGNTLLQRDGYTEHGNSRTTNLSRVEGHDEGGEDGVSAEDDPYNVRITILQYCETRRDGILAQVIPGFGRDGDDVILQSEPNPYRVCPVVKFTPHPVDNEVYGYGLGEILGQLAEVMDYNLRSQIRLIAKNADAPLLHRRSARIRRDYLRSPTGKSIEVDDVATAMGYLSPSTDQGLFAFGLNFGKQIADLATGESEIRRGAAAGADSATEAAIAESMGSIIDRLLFRRWRKFIEQCGKVMLEVLKVHVDEVQAIPLLGRDSDEFLKLRPEFLTGTFEVEFAGSSVGMNPQAEVAGLMNFGQAFGASGVIDMVGLARLVARKMGVRNPDDILAAKSGRPKVSSRHENTALFEFAQEIEVHPEDNDLQHILDHAKAMRRLQAEVPNHPGIPAMQEHLQMHLVAYQQKMAAQQGQQPGGGPIPFQLGQVGAPGQPASLQPATAGVNDARQSSNFNAAGQAPGGPTVPGRQMGQIVTGGPR